jgi:hypothetical protein
MMSSAADASDRPRLEGSVGIGCEASRPAATRCAIQALMSASIQPTARGPSCTGFGNAPSFMYW